MSPVLDIGVVVVTLFLMLAVGLELEPSAFRGLAACPGALAGGLLAQWIVLPSLAWMVVRLTGLDPHLAAALLLLSVCPVGDIANYYTLLARGNLAASIVLNAITCLLAPVTMTLAFAVFRWAGQDDALFQVPGTLLVLRLLLLVVLPLVAGALLRRVRQPLALVLSPWVQRLTALGIGALIILVIVTQRAQLAADWRPTVGAGLLFMICSLALGALFLGFSRVRREMKAVTLSFPTRNIGLACAIAIGLVGRPDYAAFAVTYFLLEVPLLVLAALWLGRGHSRPVDAA